VGKHIVRQGAETMKRTLLELGGKSALIVADDVDPAKVIPAAIGVCVHAGQACGMNTRLLVHRSLFDDVVRGVTAAFAMVPVGDPALAHTVVGPLVSAAQKHRVLAACAQAERDGAEITTGGGSYDDLPPELADGYYVAPTVVIGVDNSAAIARQEIFGPVLLILPFDTDDDAVRIANDSPYGLAGAVMSGSTERGMTIARRIRTGAIGVNGGMYYGADAPFGGYKNSGIGRQCGIEGFAQYLETKTIAHRAPRPR
jgi:aldehyde dehydrogenase (NAD+)